MGAAIFVSLFTSIPPSTPLHSHFIMASITLAPHWNYVMYSFNKLIDYDYHSLFLHSINPLECLIDIKLSNIKCIYIIFPINCNNIMLINKFWNISYTQLSNFQGFEQHSIAITHSLTAYVKSISSWILYLNSYHLYQHSN